jgi:hypothetical protein
MGTTTTEQIVREAPDIEAYKLGLLQSAKQVAEAPKTLPAYSVAGFNPDQTAAFEQARQGIGAYQPYLGAGTSALEQGVQQTQQAADVLQQADTRNQYGAAQQATNLGLGAAGQIGAAAGQIDPAYSMLGQGAGLTNQAVQQGQMAANQGTNFSQGINALYQGADQGFAASRLGAAPTAQAAQMGPASQVQASSFTDPGAASQYMSPYIQNALNVQLQEMNRQAQIQGAQRNAQAVASGAFGGSRQAIANAEAERNLMRSQADVIAQGMQGAYGSAQQQFNAEQQARLAAQQANQQAGLTTAGQNAQMQQQANLANQQLAGQFGLTGAQLGMQAGQMLQQAGQGQAGIANQAGTLGLQAAGLTGQMGAQYGQLAGQQGQLAGQQANIYNQQAGAFGQLGQGIGTLAGQQFGVGQQIAQGLGQAGAQMGNLGVQQAALGQSAQTLGQNDVNMLYNIGQQQQGLTQQQADAARNTQLQQIYQPYQDVAFMSDIYKGAPSSQQSISAATAPVPSTFQQAAGLGIAGLSAGTAAKKAGLF